MRIVIFCHSLASDWNHGNAHFLRGIASELLARGHDLTVWEPRNGWSARNLAESHGEEALTAYQTAYPELTSSSYDLKDFDVDAALTDVDVVIVHEWSAPELVRRIGEHHASNSNYRLLFHDTHHRAVTAPEEMAAYDLSNYDGVLVFGESLRQRYAEIHPSLPTWTWHEAADTRVFRPLQQETDLRDLVWIGNWGDNERASELREFLLEPVRELGLDAQIHGVRYPQEALNALSEHGVRYEGWLPNFRAPEVFATHKMTVHVPRRPYAESLPGIPTIRMFEALACGIPLVSAPWEDREGLFTAGCDYLSARDGEEMKQHLGRLVADPDLRAEQAEHGLRTILTRHTCAHRVDELMEIVNA